MKIVIEGPDGSGKSTLADQLRLQTGFPVVHGGPPINTIGEFFDRMEEKQYYTPEPRIFDRCPLVSEQAYGNPPVIDPGPLLLTTAMWYKKGDVKFIYCRGDIDKMQSSIMKGKEHKTAEWYAEIDARYREIVRRYDEIFSCIPHITYNRWEDKVPCVV